MSENDSQTGNSNGSEQSKERDVKITNTPSVKIADSLKVRIEEDTSLKDSTFHNDVENVVQELRTLRPLRPITDWPGWVGAAVNFVLAIFTYLLFRVASGEAEKTTHALNLADTSSKAAVESAAQAKESNRLAEDRNKADTEAARKTYDLQKRSVESQILVESERFRKEHEAFITIYDFSIRFDSKDGPILKFKTGVVGNAVVQLYSYSIKPVLGKREVTQADFDDMKRFQWRNSKEYFPVDRPAVDSLPLVEEPKAFFGFNDQYPTVIQVIIWYKNLTTRTHRKYRTVLKLYTVLELVGTTYNTKHIFDYATQENYNDPDPRAEKNDPIVSKDTVPRNKKY